MTIFPKEKSRVLGYFYAIIIILVLVLNLIATEELNPMLSNVFGKRVELADISIYFAIYLIISKVTLSIETSEFRIIVLTVICIALLVFNPKPAIIGLCFALMVSSIHGLIISGWKMLLLAISIFVLVCAILAGVSVL